MSMLGNDRTFLFRVSNHHAENCGPPPAVDGDMPATYHSYFENEHGEQAIFTYDLETKQGKVVLGDAGWSKAYHVEDGYAVGLVTSSSEKFWGVACWAAVTGQDFAEVIRKATLKETEDMERVRDKMRRMDEDDE